MSFENIAVKDNYYNDAVSLVKREGKASTSFIQRHLQIGYNRAARIMEQMEKEGVVGVVDSLGKRQVIGFEQRENLTEIEVMSKAENLEEQEQSRVDKKRGEKPDLPIMEDADKTNDVGGVAGKRLKSFLDRVERLEEEKKGLADDIKKIFAESKSVGFDVKTMRKILKLRAMPTDKRREEEELEELYRAALGME